MTTLSKEKLERYHRTIKSQCIRPGTPLSVEDARRIVHDYVGHYNNARLHAAIGYVAPLDKLLGREREIFAERDRKLEQARLRRGGETCYTESAWTEDRAGWRATRAPIQGRKHEPQTAKRRLRTLPCFWPKAKNAIQKTQPLAHYHSLTQLAFNSKFR